MTIVIVGSMLPGVTVGFLGLGLMGEPMAANLLKAGTRS